jgi:hypothetical protein
MESEVDEASRGLFVQVPLVVLHDRSVSHAAKLAYARLLLYAGRDGLCNPAQETLAAEVCLRPRQVRTVLSELKARGWITWKRTRTSCWYEITGPVPDRQKTADQIGRKLPVRAAENCRSDRQKTAYKKIIEKNREKKTPKRTTAYASVKPPMRSQVPVSECLPSGWTDVDVLNLQEQLAAIMDGDQPPVDLTEWILHDLARKHSLSANEVRDALQAAWHRNHRKSPRKWNWFREILRIAFVPGYAARLPEAPATGCSALERETFQEMTEAIELVGAEAGSGIRQG